MVHHRLNENETNPNPHINFITALKSDPGDQEDARQLLRALAAQVRPVMKAHGFAINSFEEYEYNRVFAGRNWNHGETLELVLRRADGTFCPTYWLMSTLCHELAHIKHMNHGPAFQALWSRLRAEVRRLQDRGYYGDGYWSSGTRLRDSARVGGVGIDAGDLPEYMCGGAQSRARPTARRRRATQGKRREVVPSLHTGAQTAKKRKAGARVTSKYAFTGEGATLANGDKGTGFGKQATSKRARDERALAAERRMQALRTQSNTSTSVAPVVASDEEFSDDEVEFVAETDAERRQALLSSEQDDDLRQKLSPESSWTQFENDFNFSAQNTATGSKEIFNDVIDISDDGDDGESCGLPVASGPTSIMTYPSPADKDKLKTVESRGGLGQKSTGRGSSLNTLGLGNIVQTEINFRKKESLGMAPIRGGGRTLGSTESKPISRKERSPSVLEPPVSEEHLWICLVCTLENAAEHLACSVCTTPRGEKLFQAR